MPRYDWIIFDFTGTLMTPDPEPAEAYYSAAKASGSEHSLEQIRDQLKAAMKRHFFEADIDQPTDEAGELRRWRRIVADAIPDLPDESADKVFDSLWHHFATAETWRLYDDVPPTIGRLRSKGYAIAVASNFDRRLTMILGDMGLKDQFDEVLISSQLGWSKPSTRFYDAAVARLGAAQLRAKGSRAKGSGAAAWDATDRSRLLMIGDTKRGDVDAARQAGLDARLLVRGGETALAELTADL
ncbi:dUMP phosphatase [Stieleria maiorica]|uniref:dUMP phosphatase n=1 Tax=Stieleria maiorica TaxID=2795974 RepID=A0A5B9M4J9_9BACT|nr:HAD family hydrolase [Stieleria maiorica]QEF96158.1 dUMP phosphatase [Stieleria maiorica]